MNFGFDEDQKSLADTVSQMLADHAGLVAPELTTAHREAVMAALAEVGLFALLVPERFGGVGLSLVDLALAVEELGAGLAPLAAASTLAAIDAIVRHGTAPQQARLLPGLAAGETKVAIAVLEAERGYDPSAVQTAVHDGMLRGSKIVVADAEDADLILVIASAEGKPGIVMVEKGASGLTIRPHEDIDPTAGLCELRFDGIEIVPDAVLGQAARERAVERLIDVSATLYAGMLMGIAARMLGRAVDYAGTRVQFGQAIGAFQAIKHRCADMAVAVEAGRSAAYYAFWAVSEDTPDRARATSMAKAYCGDIARNVCNETIQVHGGMGFTWELGLHRFLRRAKVMEHAFGDQAWHNERIVAQTLTELATGSARALDAA